MARAETAAATGGMEVGEVAEEMVEGVEGATMAEVAKEAGLQVEVDSVLAAREEEATAEAKGEEMAAAAAGV